MSSLSGVGSSTDLYALLNPLDPQDSSQTGAAAPLPVAGTDADGDNDGTIQSASSTQGRHHKGIPSQIETAVTNALQNAATGTDPNTTIQQAIASVLDPTGTQTAAATDASDDTSSNSTSSFNQLLQANGVDPQQFQQDLADALGANSSNGTAAGNVDFAALFRSFPPGSAVDTLG